MTLDIHPMMSLHTMYLRHALATGLMALLEGCLQGILLQAIPFPEAITPKEGGT